MTASLANATQDLSTTGRATIGIARAGQLPTPVDLLEILTHLSCQRHAGSRFPELGLAPKATALQLETGPLPFVALDDVSVGIVVFLHHYRDYLFSSTFEAVMSVSGSWRRAVIDAMEPPESDQIDSSLGRVTT
jgi:hypothetical protein